MTVAARKLTDEQLRLLHEGTVIPAHPLALTEDRQLDERRQRALTRYYMAAGAGGVAVGVHTTQFEIRDPHVNLFERVLRVAAEEVERAQLDRPFLKVAGICGPTAQAVAEAETAVRLGYDLGLLSMGGLQDWSEEELLARTREIANIIPVFGFYLQPSVGGRILSFDFWRQLAQIPGVMAIKMAPFNRYQTIDVVRAVCYSDRRDEIALYTGNDDNIVADLLTAYRFQVNGHMVEKRIVGGLLGHWSVWTKKAVELLDDVKAVRRQIDAAGGGPIAGHGSVTDGASGVPAEMVRLSELLTRNIAVTDTNAAFFDSANKFAGCIAGLHEVLRRQGLLEGIWCLNPDEGLSPGQAEEIDRMYEEYPELSDDAFVRENVRDWLG